MLAETVLEKAADCLRLLCNLLCHEVRVSAQRGCRGIPVDRKLRRFWHRRALRIDHIAGAILVQACKLPILELDDLLRLAGKRRDVRGRIAAIRRLGDDKRRAAACADNLSRRLCRDDSNRPGAFKARDCDAGGLEEVMPRRSCQGLLDEVRYDLGVGIAPELMARSDELRPELAEVLDDAVMDDSGTASAVHMRMGIAVGRRPVRCPPCMGNARRADEICALCALGERRDASCALDAVELSIRREHLDACRIVSTVFEGRESLEEKWSCLLGADVADDAAHGEPPC